MSKTRFRNINPPTDIGAKRPATLVAAILLALTSVIAGCASSGSSSSSVIVGGREVNVENTDESKEHLKIIEGG
ncbi:MAG: hypothetical protein AAGI44_10265, partial [Pseudomonadota bacterium]